jgi:hypothetical protein
MTHNDWKELYRAAVLETDQTEMGNRVKAAEEAFDLHTSNGNHLSGDERAAMDNAGSSLQVLKQERVR